MATPSATPYTLAKRPASDPAAAFAGVLVSVLGALGLAEKWGISPDDVLVVVGAIATLAAAVRSWWHRRLQAQQAAVDAVAIAADARTNGTPRPFMEDDETPITDPKHLEEQL